MVVDSLKKVYEELVAKVNFHNSNRAESFVRKLHFSTFFGNVHKKIRNSKYFFKGMEIKILIRTEQAWKKICWRGEQNEQLRK